MEVKHKKLKKIGVLLSQILILTSLCVACGGGSGSAVKTSPIPIAPSIITQPSSLSVVLGSTASFSVVASGDAPLTYQWQRNGVDIAGAISSTYSLSTTQSSDANNTWTVVVANAIGKSKSADVKVRFTGIDLIAGSIGGSGNLDGVGAAARFGSTNQVAVDSAGNLYVADSENAVIRKITRAGLVTTLAGKSRVRGSADGIGEAARFFFPDGVAVDAGGNVFVADIGNQVIRKITPAGVVSTFSDIPDDTTAAKLATDSIGNIYFVSTDRNWSFGSLYKISQDRVKTSLLIADTRIYSPNRLHGPSGIALDLAGNIYVTDRNRAIRIVSAGSVTTLVARADGASADGIGVSGIGFDLPHGIGVDAAGNVYVSDIGNKNILKITADRFITSLAGMAGVAGSTDGAGAAARFDRPGSLTLDSAGNLYVMDKHVVRKITPSAVVATLAGQPEITGASDGAANVASLNHPNGVAVDGVGNVYVADTDNNVVRRIMANGVVTTLAGTAGLSGSTDGAGAAARFRKPHGGTVDASGNFYVIDDIVGSQICSIRKITPAGIVSTLSSCDPQDPLYGAANSLAVDSVGNMYLADMENHTVRKITAAGVASTFAGTRNLAGSVDGIGMLANFNSPKGVAVDNADNVYIADTLNHTIRKITAAGLVTTLAGNPNVAGSADGTGSAATFGVPQALAVDKAGNVYVADGVQLEQVTAVGLPRNITVGNNIIRKITPAGLVTTVVGKVGSDGIVLGRLPGSLYNPTSLTIDPNDVLYVTSGNAVLKIQL